MNPEPAQALFILREGLLVLEALLVAVSLVISFWGLIKYISSAGDEIERTHGKRTLLFGITSLLLLMLVWLGLSYLGVAPR